MGDVVAFFRPDAAQEPAAGGTIHIWMGNPQHFEIGHESRSGNSWGYFATFNSAEAAIDAAHRLNREELDGKAEVYIPDAILAHMAGGVGR